MRNLSIMFRAILDFLTTMTKTRWWAEPLQYTHIYNIKRLENKVISRQSDQMPDNNILTVTEP